jgi:hypothetical protein
MLAMKPKAVAISRQKTHRLIRQDNKIAAFEPARRLTAYGVLQPKPTRQTRSLRYDLADH